MRYVAIKDMERPKNCNECRFSVDGWCYAYPGQGNRDALSKREVTNWCPIVIVEGTEVKEARHENR